MTLNDIAALGEVPLMALIAWFLWQQRNMTEKHLSRIDTLIEMYMKKDAE